MPLGYFCLHGATSLQILRSQAKDERASACLGLFVQPIIDRNAVVAEGARDGRSGMAATAGGWLVAKGRKPERE